MKVLSFFATRFLNRTKERYNGRFGIYTVYSM